MCMSRQKGHKTAEISGVRRSRSTTSNEILDVAEESQKILRDTRNSTCRTTRAREVCLVHLMHLALIFEGISTRFAFRVCRSVIDETAVERHRVADLF